MSTTATVRLTDHFDSELLVRDRVDHVRDAPRVAPGYVDDVDAWFENEQLELFHDWDSTAGRGRGFFTKDEAECRSRRVDLRGPTDADPGPIEMEEPTRR